MHSVTGSLSSSKKSIILLVRFSKDEIVSNSPLTLPVCFFIKVVSNLLCEPLTSPKRSTNDCNLAWKIRASCIEAGAWKSDEDSFLSEETSIFLELSTEGLNISSSTFTFSFSISSASLPMVKRVFSNACLTGIRFLDISPTFSSSILFRRSNASVMVISFSYSFFEIVVLEPSISSPPPTVRVPEDFPELSASGNFFSFLLNRLPNERGGDTVHLYPNHNKTLSS